MNPRLEGFPGKVTEDVRESVPVGREIHLHLLCLMLVFVHHPESLLTF